MRENYVKVQIRADKKGNFTRKIIRDGQSTCESGDDRVFLEDLFNIELPDYYGDFGKVTIDGLTEEGECDTNAKLKHIDVDSAVWTPEPELEEKNKRNKNKSDKKMDLGFGV